MSSNLKRHDVQGNIPPDPAHMLPQAYGTPARMASFIRSARSPDAIIRLKAVTEISGAVHREEDARVGMAATEADAGEGGMLGAMMALMSENSAGTAERSSEIRARATETLATVALHASTRVQLLRCIPSLMERLADLSTVVRIHAYTALDRLVGSVPECAEDALRRGVLQRLVAAAYAEDAAVRERSLSCLNSLSSSSIPAAVAAVAAGAVRALIEVVGPAPVAGAGAVSAEAEQRPSSPAKRVSPSQSSAARALLPLCATAEGRRDLVAHPRAIDWICAWLEGAGAGPTECAEERSVHTSAAALAASAALETSGKRALFAGGASRSLLAIVQHSAPGNPQLLYAVQAIGCLAELPAAREALKAAVPLLQELEKARTASDLEVRAAVRARQVITWTP